MKKVSDTMLDAIRFAEKHGGKLHRHPGGFWAGPSFSQNCPGVSFGTTTANALVTRGLATYTAEQHNARGSFPIEATITDAGRAALDPTE